MPTKERYTTKEVIDALREANGYVSKTASILQCDTVTVYNYRNRHSTVAQAWKDIREKRHDYVENALAKRIDSGDTTAIIFYLKTQCKERGYNERTQVELGSDPDRPIRTESKHEHAIDGDTAESIFDILAQIGAVPTAPDDAEDDEVHTARTD